MSKILELADAYAVAAYMHMNPDAEIPSAERAALVAEVEKLEQEHIQRLLRIEQKVDVLIAERDALRAENEQLKSEMADQGPYIEKLRMQRKELRAALMTANGFCKSLEAERDQLLIDIKRMEKGRDSIARLAAKFEAELEAARKDAGRYRFIETHPDYGACIWSDGEDGTFGWFHVTAAQIDAAMEATK